MLSKATGRIGLVKDPKTIKTDKLTGVHQARDNEGLVPDSPAYQIPRADIIEVNNNHVASGCREPTASREKTLRGLDSMEIRAQRYLDGWTTQPTTTCASHESTEEQDTPGKRAKALIDPPFARNGPTW